MWQTLSASSKKNLLPLTRTLQAEHCSYTYYALTKLCPLALRKKISAVVICRV